MTDTSVASPSAASQQPTLQGYLRRDGRKGIRNVVAVAYLVECAHHVAREIVTQFREPLDAFDDPSAEREPPVHLIGFPGCYPNSYAEKMLERLTTQRSGLGERDRAAVDEEQPPTPGHLVAGNAIDDLTERLVIAPEVTLEERARRWIEKDMLAAVGHPVAVDDERPVGQARALVDQEDVAVAPLRNRGIGRAAHAQQRERRPTARPRPRPEARIGVSVGHGQPPPPW